MDGVSVMVGVAVREGVGVIVAVLVGVGVKVSVEVGLGVAVAVGVGVGVAKKLAIPLQPVVSKLTTTSAMSNPKRGLMSCLVDSNVIEIPSFNLTHYCLQYGY